MRLLGVTLAFVILASITITPNANAQFTISTLTLSLNTDGFADIDYRVTTDPTTANITLPLLGSTITNLVITDQNQLPLSYQLKNTEVTIVSLGSSIEISYSTPSLTSKTGDLWGLNFTAPISTSLILPQGATLVSLSQIPLEISTINQRQSVLLPDGLNEITYQLGIVGTKEHSLLIITDAETAINQAKSKGLVTTFPDTLLAKAKSYFTLGKYVSAEDYAGQAKNAVTTLTAFASEADTKIKIATSLIETAKSEGRSNGLDKAVTLLDSATSAYKIGNYTKASSLASQAITNTSSATKPFDTTILLAGVAIVAIIVIGAIILLRGRKLTRNVESPPEIYGVVDLASIYSEFPDLREEDREVLQFISESGGKAYSDEIRDEFEMPKTSTWRLVKRLLGLGIIGEKKIGVKSLVYIQSKYIKEK